MPRSSGGLRREFDAEIIALCVRWVIRYVPEFEKRWHRFARRISSSWRVDETYVCIRGKWHYLYRAVDKQGLTADFLLWPDRGVAAAQVFFRRALATKPTRWPSGTVYSPHFGQFLSHGCIDVEEAAIGSEVVVKWGDYGGPIKEIRATVERFPYLSEGRNSDIDAPNLPQ